MTDSKDQIESLLESLKPPKVTGTEQSPDGRGDKLWANKSPGADGYTAEWYKTLREVRIPLLQKPLTGC